MNWNDLRLFLALARAGSVRSAAFRLSISHSTVVRRIAALEKSLGVRLFERLATGYILTPIGEKILQKAEQVENDIHGIELNILGQDANLSGNIRVIIPEPLIVYLLMPDLQKFKQAYPDIDLEIITSYEFKNLATREADVAILVISDPPEYLVGHRLPNFNFSFYASPEYLKEHNLNADPPTANWIGMNEFMDSSISKWFKDSPYPYIPVRWTMPLMSLPVAAEAGLGMVRLPCFIGDRIPGLQRIPPEKVIRGNPGWVLTLDDLHTTERVRTFMSFIAQVISHKIDLIDVDSTSYSIPKK